MLQGQAAAEIWALVFEAICDGVLLSATYFSTKIIFGILVWPRNKHFGSGFHIFEMGKPKRASAQTTAAARAASNGAAAAAAAAVSYKNFFHALSTCFADFFE